MVHMGEKSGTCRVLVGKPKGKRPLEWSRHRWEDSITMGFEEIACGNMDWIHLVQDKDG